jgi:hypothetical protein
MAEKARQVIPGLGNLPNLIPAADPRTMDNYSRPGAPEIHGPASTNPMLQLSDALAKLEPTLSRATTMAAEQYGAEEVAAGEKEFWSNREKWNAEIRAGRLPEGASPYYQRGLQRAALKQQAGDFYAQVHADFYGESGAEARASNDPAVMQKFLNDARTKYYDKNMRVNGRDTFTALDMQDVFNPAAEQVYKTMLQTHAAYRVSEREKEYEALASTRIGTEIEQAIQNMPAGASDEERELVFRDAAKRANDVLYNPDMGIVKNGLPASKGNQLLVDAVSARMLKTGNRSYAEILDYIKGGGGAPISKTQYAQAKIQATEEHLLDQDIKLAHFRHWQDGLDFEARSRQHTEEEWNRGNERWKAEQEQYARQGDQRSLDRLVKAAQQRVFFGLRQNDPARAKETIDDALKVLEGADPEKAAQARGWVDTITKQRSDYPDDPMTVADIRLDISHNPLGFNDQRIKDAVNSKLMKPSTALQMMDDLERNQHDADHPYMRQREFREMMDDVRNGSLKNAEDMYGAEGRLRATAASQIFRDYAIEWLESNPNKSMASFRVYMRDKVQETLERANATYGAEQKQQRAAQEQKGREVQQVTSAEQGEKRQKEADQQDLMASREQARQELDQYRQEITTGQRTAEGRKILREGNTIKTEETITIQDKRINEGRPTNIPTIYNGKKVSDKEAVEIIAKNKGVDPDTGRKLPGYYPTNPFDQNSAIDAAVAAAKERSARLGKEYKDAPGYGNGSVTYPKPSEKAVGALKADPSKANIDTFTKKFGPDSLPKDLKATSAETTSGRFLVEEGEIVDSKTGTIITAGQFNRRATEQEKTEVEKLLRDAGFLAE